MAVFVVAKLVASGEVLGLECRTSHAEAGANGCAWDDWLTFSIKYRDLPHSTQLTLTCWEMRDGRPTTLLGGAAMPMFNKRGRLKTGPQDLKVCEGVEPSGKPGAGCNCPGKLSLRDRGRLGQLEHLVQMYQRGDVPQLDWLDKLAFKEIDRMRSLDHQQVIKQPRLRLSIALPTFPHAVLYQQPAASSSTVGPAASLTPSGKDAGAPALAPQGGILLLHDPQVGWENPAELKAQKLARSLTRGIIDRDLKPNSEERRRIAAVLKLPPNKPLHAEERALMWRFRFALTQDKRALTKFLKCVDWSDITEAKQAAELMQQWAPIDVADALELLSPDFKNEEVRSHAVAVLQRQDDEELLAYLLQLVQALRYEAADNSKLAKFLITRATQNPAFATFLHWYLFTEWEDPNFGTRASAVHTAFVNALHAAPRGDRVWEAIRRQTDMVSQLAYVNRELKVSKLRAARATERLREMVSETGTCGELTTCRVPLPLNPNIMLEGLVPSECFVFRSAQLPLKLSYKINPNTVDWAAGAPLAPNGALAAALASSLGEGIADASAPASHAAAGTVSTGGQGPLHEAQLQPPLAPPVAAHKTGIVVTPEGQYRCMMLYKKGDDLRQDQFVLQMISLMDRLLKREALDLHLTPYRVLPTSGDDGLVQFVPSTPLSRVLAEHRTIHKFLLQHQAEPGAPHGLKPSVLDTFVRSCAGYCVCTYILGVGDRHLDNLMLTPEGELFHIDFGYILGNDPKPFPPPMKLCKEMIEAMGGQDSNYYVQFRMYSCEAYNILRKSADLILSLFHLMAGSSIDAIRQDPEKAMLKLQEKLRLEFDDEQAVEWMQQLINESATALMPQIVETTHRWAQYWR